ncbi:2-hydroxychromene-2-carboxylate isomerase [Marinobacter sp. JSM 1782161]|uniref:2-hydroxychromene-2-carboxylate isomerase n=1 Tax=Marinobacter sp. JSM 1782161 TaxID=2685906 RepID=UPI00140286E5|nr:2-hydroxychromene-2-carboxylate isomerase [Marinobacter sp. JSM 1782161]
MKQTIDVYFDVGSPASYLAWTQLPDLAARHGARINWRPILLGAVFQATGNQTPAAIPAKGRYMSMDLQRFAQAYGVDFRFNPHFPVNTLMLMRGAVAYLDSPRLQDYLGAVFRALWVDGQNMGEPDVVADVLARAGFDPQEVLGKVEQPDIKKALKDITAHALERGVFGAPTLFLGDAMYFGQDRLWQVEEALADSAHSTPKEPS